MISLDWGPFLFDTGAESWLARTQDPILKDWLRQYLSLYPVHVSAITVLERIRGYSVLTRRATANRRDAVDAARTSYLRNLGYVWPVDAAVAVMSAEIMALLPQPPTPPVRAHRLAESREERLARWRLDCIIAATALVTRMILIHRNPADFESIRSAVETTPGRFPKLGPLGLIRCESLV